MCGYTPKYTQVLIKPIFHKLAFYSPGAFPTYTCYPAQKKDGLPLQTAQL